MSLKLATTLGMSDSFSPEPLGMTNSVFVARFDDGSKESTDLRTRFSRVEVPAGAGGDDDDDDDCV
eukprot:scaffold130561_cov17-Cyclotella_meneghiniana.AAC.1